MKNNCVFCGILDKQLPAAVVYEDEHCIAFMDIYPLRPGHVLVVPKRHAQHVHELTSIERTQLMEAGAKISEALRASSLQPAALHFQINDGKAALQTVPHVHLHLLPRYQGDFASFMFSILKKPAQFLLKPEKPEVLERQARAIREKL